MLSAALLLSERPAEALFGIGDSSKSYETETVQKRLFAISEIYLF